jgi:hypothetical protein
MGVRWLGDTCACRSCFFMGRNRRNVAAFSGNSCGCRFGISELSKFRAGAPRGLSMRVSNALEKSENKAQDLE